MNSKPVISKKDARSKLGIPHDKFVLGSIGRLNHVKGFDILIEAVKNLNSDNNSLLFVVAGQGNEKNELERRVIEYNLQDKIKFIGFLENTEDLLAALDVFLLTSRSEGFPLSLLEAMNFKLPTIATDVGGIRDLLVDGKAGLIIPPENKFELVKAIRILFENPNLLSQYSELSYNRSLDFSIETCAGLYLKKYQDLLEQ
jgi:glycosyltransferase involved in cell wall biosynthesis